MRRTWFALAGLTLLLGAACGGDDDDDAGSTVERLGDQPVNDHGTTDASGESSIEFETADFYFKPTFLRGEPGQKLMLKVANEGNATHNLTFAGVDSDMAAGGKAEVEVTFPQSGVALFFCKFHQGQGMVGELLVGDAQPTAATGPSPQPGGAQNPYGY